MRPTDEGECRKIMNEVGLEEEFKYLINTMRIYIIPIINT